jgi:hypothetical protein
MCFLVENRTHITSSVFYDMPIKNSSSRTELGGLYIIQYLSQSNFSFYS